MRFAASAALAMLAAHAVWLSVTQATLPASGRGVWFALLSTAVVSTSAAVAVAWWLGRRAAARLDRLRRAIEHIQHAESPEPLSAGPRDEIGGVVESVNGLAEAAAIRARRLMESALTDSLTGLPNRALLADRIRHMIAVSQRSRSGFAVALLDLDRFKFVNDTLGHAAGDVLLKEVARRLRATVRDSDTVARLGGDEFVLVMAGGLDAAREVSRRVLESMKTPLRHDEQLIDIGISIGIALYPDHGEDDADAAAARRLGDVSRQAHAFRRAGVRRRARRGAAQLPVVARRDARGARERPVRARLPAEAFVAHRPDRRARGAGALEPPGARPGSAQRVHPVCRANRIHARGHRMGGRARSRVLAHAAAEAGLNLEVSVNVSALDIQNPDFAANCSMCCAAPRPTRSRLCLEITESGVVSESEVAIRNLRAIARLGVKLSVDDFGTGYATLKQLQQLPVNELKIDRSFVAGIHRHRGNLTIVRSTIELGKQLGLKVVAEGVESVEELRCLARLGCDEVQGYYLSRPMREADVAGWVEMRHALHASSRESYYAMLTEKP